MKKLKDAYDTDKVTQWRPVNGWKSVESISKILNSPQQTNRATRGRPAGIVPDPVSIEFKRPDPAFVQEILNRRTPVMEVEMVSEPKTKGAISADATANVDNEDDDLVNMLAGEGNMLASFPNREKGLAIGGSITSFWYGLAVGLFIAGIIAFQLIKAGI